MKKLSLFAALVCAAILSVAPLAHAGYYGNCAQAPAGTSAPCSQVDGHNDSGGHAQPDSTANPHPVIGTPYSTFTSLTVGTSATAGRAIIISCTIGGTVSLTLANGGTMVINVVPGTVVYPFEVTEVNNSGTNATATYGNLN